DVSSMRDEMEELYQLDPSDKEVANQLDRLRKQDEREKARRWWASVWQLGYFSGLVVLFGLIAFVGCVLGRGISDRFVASLWTNRELAYTFGLLDAEELAREKEAFEAQDEVSEARKKQREQRAAHEKDLEAVRKRHLRISRIDWYSGLR